MKFNEIKEFIYILNFWIYEFIRTFVGRITFIYYCKNEDFRNFNDDIVLDFESESQSIST